MHVTQYADAPMAATYSVGVPETGPHTGKTREPSIAVRPFGDGRATPLWLLTADEAEGLAEVLLKAAKESRDLFPGG